MSKPNTLINTQKAGKKSWQKPDFYILDTNSVNGGGPNTFSHEIHNGNHTQLKTPSGGTAGVPTGVYNLYHS